MYLRVAVVALTRHAVGVRPWKAAVAVNDGSLTRWFDSTRRHRFSIQTSDLLATEVTVTFEQKKSPLPQGSRNQQLSGLVTQR